MHTPFIGAFVESVLVVFIVNVVRYRLNAIFFHFMYNTIRFQFDILFLTVCLYIKSLQGVSEQQCLQLDIYHVLKISVQCFHQIPDIKIERFNQVYLIVPKLDY